MENENRSKCPTCANKRLVPSDRRSLPRYIACPRCHAAGPVAEQRPDCYESRQMLKRDVVDELERLQTRARAGLLSSAEVLP